MAGLGYKAVKPSSFDVTDIAAQQQALDLRDKQMQLQSQLYNERNKPKVSQTKIEAAWTPFADVAARAATQIAEDMKSLYSIKDRQEYAKKVTDINRKREELAQFTKTTNQWKSDYEKGKTQLNNGNFYKEDIDSFNLAPQEFAGELGFQAVGGEIKSGDESWANVARNFKGFETPTPIKEDLVSTFIDKHPPSDFLFQNGDYDVRNDELLKTTLEGYARDALNNGYSKDDVAYALNEIEKAYPKSMLTKQSTNNGGNFISIGGNKYDTGDYKIEKTKLKDEGGTTDAAVISYGGKNQNPPMIRIMRYDEGKDKNVAEQVTITQVKRVGDGRFIAGGVGYDEELSANSETYEFTERMTPRKPIEFVIGEDSKSIIENEYFGGAKLEEVFGGQQKSQATTKQEGNKKLGKSNGESFTDFNTRTGGTYIDWTNS